MKRIVMVVAMGLAGCGGGEKKHQRSPIRCRVVVVVPPATSEAKEKTWLYVHQDGYTVIEYLEEPFLNVRAQISGCWGARGDEFNRVPRGEQSPMEVR